MKFIWQVFNMMKVNIYLVRFLFLQKLNCQVKDIFFTNSNFSCFIWKLVETHHRHSLYFSWPSPMDSSLLAWATPWKGRVPRRCESWKAFPDSIYKTVAIYNNLTSLLQLLWIKFQVISAASDDYLKFNSTKSPAQVKLYVLCQTTGSSLIL